MPHTTPAPLSASQLYRTLEAASAPMDHHASDLYVPVTDATRALIAQYHFREMVTTFRDADGQMWYDIPFAYLPFWRQREVTL